MSDKKLVVIVAGMGDTLISENSQRKLKNAESLRQNVEKALDHFKNSDNYVGIVDLHYSTDTRKDVNVFKAFPDTRIVDVKLNTRSVIHANNEINVLTHEGDKIIMKGTELTYLFRPSEYEVVFVGVDLHGMFLEAIEELLSQGYTVKLVKDALSTFPASLRSIREIQEKNRSTFSFCSYNSI